MLRHLFNGSVRSSFRDQLNITGSGYKGNFDACIAAPAGNMVAILLVSLCKGTAVIKQSALSGPSNSMPTAS